MQQGYVLTYVLELLGRQGARAAAIITGGSCSLLLSATQCARLIRQRKITAQHTGHRQGSESARAAVVHSPTCASLAIKGSGVTMHTRARHGAAWPTSATDTGHRQGSGHECRYRLGASSGSKCCGLLWTVLQYLLQLHGWYLPNSG